MGIKDLYHRVAGISPVVVKWREPPLYRLRLRGDILLRVAIVVAMWMAATGVMLVLFAFNNNPPGFGLAAGLGLVFGFGPGMLLTFLLRGQVSGSVWVREDCLHRQRSYASANLLSGNWVESEQWYYPAIRHCQLVLGQDLGSNYAVLLVSDGEVVEMFGVPAQVDLRSLVEHLSANGLQVSQGRAVPAQFSRPLHAAAPAVTGLLGLVLLMLGGVIYWQKTGGDERVARRPHDVAAPVAIEPPVVFDRPSSGSPAPWPEPTDTTGEPADSGDTQDQTPLTPPQPPIPSIFPPSSPGRRPPYARANPFGRATFQPGNVVPSPRPETPTALDETELVGGTGGGPFRQTSPGNVPLMGFRYSLGQWAGEAAIGRLDPVFGNAPAPDLKDSVLARPGYAVGALKVHAGQYVNALQVVFMRVTADGRLDPDDSYTSDWIGTPGSGEPKMVGGTGERVIGIQGRRAAILDAIGLVLQRPEH